MRAYSDKIGFHESGCSELDAVTLKKGNGNRQKSDKNRLNNDELRLFFVSRRFMSVSVDFTSAL